MKNHIPSALTLAVSLVLAQAASAQFQGPSTGSTPYLLPSNALIQTHSIITVDNVTSADDLIGGYGMAGIPDGLGAFQTSADISNGTFTVLMNHELQATAGAVRAHGATGAFVSQWTINKNTLAVTAGSDLIQQVSTWNTGSSSYNAPTTGIQIGRLCSGDLAAPSAYFDSGTGFGTTARIFQSGEESGAEGRQFAHIVTGAAAGISYELPRLGKFSWENGVANPNSGVQTVVIGTDDSSPGQIYVYVGTKTNTGNDIERAGLTNGNLFGIKAPVALESRTNGLDGATPGAEDSVAFTMHNFGNVQNTTGAALQTASGLAGVTEFLRPEDVHWDPNTSDIAYFVTTDTLNASGGRSRLYKLDFNDSDFTLGGQLTMLIEGGTPGDGDMFDNMVVTMDGKIVLQEDPGGNAVNAKVWSYDIATDTLTEIAKHDVARFGEGPTLPTAPFTNNEEASGVIDITDLMAGSALNTGNPGEKWYLMDVQAHYNGGITSAQVEGGQLLAVHVVPEPSTAICLLGGLGMLLGLRRRA